MHFSPAFNRVCLIGLSSALLFPTATSLYGDILLHSVDKSTFNAGLLIKDKHSNCKRGPRGPRGHKGHDGKQGVQGDKGDAGTAGEPGPAGPVVVGLAQSFTPDKTFDGQMFTISSQGSLLSVLLNTASTSNITFDSSTSTFTIQKGGNYLISYGLSAAADPMLVNEWISGDGIMAWISVERHTGGSPGNTSEIGAIPLSLSQSLANNNSDGSKMVSGYGQLATPLVVGDTVKLMLFLQDYNATSYIFRINSDQITYNGQSLNQGGTLSLLLMP